MVKKKDESDPRFVFHSEINQENYADIHKLGILPLKLLDGISQVLVLGEFSLIDVLVDGNSGSVFYKKWADLWVEQVSLLCFKDANRSAGYRFTIRERFFYKSIYEKERRMSDSLPAEPFFYRHYLPDNGPPHHEGLCWYGAAKSVDEHAARFETARIIVQLLGDADYENMRRLYFEALDRYISTYPSDSEITKTKFAKILYRGASRSQLYRNNEKAPLLWEEIRREFYRRENR